MALVIDSYKLQWSEGYMRPYLEILGSSNNFKFIYFQQIDNIHLNKGVDDIYHLYSPNLTRMYRAGNLYNKIIGNSNDRQ